MEKLGVHLWSKQVEITDAVQVHPRVAVRSCHDSGKSFVAAILAAWWLDTHPAGSAFVVTSAPTHHQVRAILWREIGRMHRKGSLRGKVNQTEWWIGGEMVAFGRKPADYDPDAFQGIHARYVLVILDEANGIPKALWDAAESLATNEDSRILAIGNPDTPSSEFAQVCKPTSGFHKIKISADDTPNFTGEWVPEEVRHNLLSRWWVEDKKHKWGITSPLYVSKVQAEFPEDADDGVVPNTWAWGVAGPREGIIPELDQIPVELGVDVGGGSDLTVIRERRGIIAGRVWTDNTPNPEQGVDKILHALRETGATRVKVDTIGVGYAVKGWLEKEIRQIPELRHVKVIGVNVAESSSDPKRFPLLRDELWWKAREMSDPRDPKWYLGAMEELEDTLAELTAPRYSLATKGRIKVEPKEDTVKRLGHSPDHADALNLAFYEGGKKAKGISSQSYV